MGAVPRFGSDLTDCGAVKNRFPLRNLSEPKGWFCGFRQPVDRIRPWAASFALFYLQTFYYLASIDQRIYKGAVVSNGVEPDPNPNSVTGAISTGDSPGENKHCWISFGGNVGNVKATFDAALALLSLHSQIRLGKRSGLYCSTPMGSQAGNPFLNSVCGLTTGLAPQDLLLVLQSVEMQLGRVREIDWGPRTLDLDLLSYGDQIIDEPKLVIPHPAMTYRRFVLDPLLEIDPDWRHPAFGESTTRTLSRLGKRPLQIALLEIPADQVCELSGQLATYFSDLEWVSGPPWSEDVLPIHLSSSSPPAGLRLIDLRRSPGDLRERLRSALTAIFDAPKRISDW